MCQFKFINDNFGFATGDQVLQASGKILQEILKMMNSAEGYPPTILLSC
ncbi:MAG: diguanylate cyclase domain-containing protein [Phascolarctobacterium faecium]